MATKSVGVFSDVPDVEHLTRENSIPPSRVHATTGISGGMAAEPVNRPSAAERLDAMLGSVRKMERVVSAEIVKQGAPESGGAGDQPRVPSGESTGGRWTK